jgi:N-acyl-D-amino-acid deacylase
VNRRQFTVAGAIAVGGFIGSGLLAQSDPRAWTIVGAQIADGSGRPLRQANVRIAGGRIAAVGSVDPRPGDSVVDAKGLIVAPGFIDIHNHSSSELAADPAAESQVAQGITTVVLGPDGSSPW